MSAIAGAGAVITGVAMGPDTSMDAKWYERNRNILAAGVGVLLGMVTKYEFDRSNAASEAAATMRRAMVGSGSDHDQAAYDACLMAEAKYDEANKVTNDDIFKELDKQIMTAKATADDANATAKDAKTAADEAMAKTKEVTLGLKPGSSILEPHPSTTPAPASPDPSAPAPSLPQ